MIKPTRRELTHITRLRIMATKRPSAKSFAKMSEIRQLP